MKKIAIIGAGITGLYLNYFLKKVLKTIHKDAKIKIFEQTDRYGGRILSDNFHDVTIQLGAGFIREFDVNVLEFLKTFNIPFKDSPMSFTYMINQYNREKYHKMLDVMKKFIQDNQEISKETSVKDWLIENFSKTDYDFFLKHSKWIDFIHASLDTMEYYPITDLYHENVNQFSLDFNDIFQTLIKEGKPNIFFKTEIKSVINRRNYDQKSLVKDSTTIQNLLSQTIHTPAHQYLLQDQNDKVYTADAIFFTSLEASQIEFFPFSHKYDKNQLLSSHIPIFTIPFLKIYTFHENGHGITDNILSDSTLKKILPITDKILLATYSEEDDAVINFSKWNHFNTIENKQNWLLEELKKATKRKDIPSIDDCLVKFWRAGTHGWKPFKEEKISKTKGWIDLIENDYEKQSLKKENFLYLIG